MLFVQRCRLNQVKTYTLLCAALKANLSMSVNLSFVRTLGILSQLPAAPFRNFCFSQWKPAVAGRLSAHLTALGARRDAVARGTVKRTPTTPRCSCRAVAGAGARFASLPGCFVSLGLEECFRPRPDMNQTASVSHQVKCQSTKVIKVSVVTLVLLL